MAMTVPHMQQRYTGYDFGQNTARNWLDAVRIKNQAEAEDRKLGILEASEARMAADYEADLLQRQEISKFFKDKTSVSKEHIAQAKREEQAASLSTADWTYRLMQQIVDKLPFAITPGKGIHIPPSTTERAAQESGAPSLPEDPSIVDYDIIMDEEMFKYSQENEPFYNLLNLLQQSGINFQSGEGSQYIFGGK